MSAPPAGLIALLRRRYAPLTSDGDLVRAYAAGRDESAFRQIVARHGPAVLRLCRRRLGDVHSAEDAFQATFLVLARGAGAIRKPDALAAWLYGVAYRITHKARLRAARRRRLEARAVAPPSPDPAADITARELLDVLDDELHRLPERYRVPVWLCYWQGLTQEEAARRLGCSPGAVKGRLERGRAKLAERLTRRGFAPSALLVAPLATAAVPPDLLAATAALAADPWSRALPAAVLALVATAAPAKLAPAVALGVLFVGAGLFAAAWRAGSVSDRSESPPVADAPGSPADSQPAVPRVDRFGDPLPPGAVQRLGTSRHRTAWYITSPHRFYLSDGRTLLTHNSSQVWRFEADTGREIDSWTSPRGFTLCGMTPDGRLVALVNDEMIRIWDLPARKEVRAIASPVKRGGATATFSPDARQLVLDDQDEQNRSRLQLWDIASGQQLWCNDQLGAQGTSLHVCGFRSDGRTLVAMDGSGNNAMGFVLDRTTGKVVRSFSCPFDDEVVLTSDQVRLAPDGAILYVRSDRAALRFRDLETGQERSFPNGGPRFAFSSDGTRLVTQGPDSFASVWDWPSGRLLRQIRLDPYANLLGFTPDGKRLETAGPQDSLVRFWDVDTGQAVPPPEGHTCEVFAVRFADDGTVVTVENTAARFWDPATGRLVRQASIPVPVGVGVKFVSADGRIAVTGLGHSPPQISVQLWDTATGQSLHVIGPLGLSASRAAVSADGRLLATRDMRNPTSPGHLGDIHLWDVASGREMYRFEDPGGGGMAGGLVFSPDGRFLVSAGLGGARVWDTADGRRVRAWDGDVLCVAFAPDGRSLVSVTDKEIVVRESAGGGVRWRIATSERRLYGSWGVPIAFTPDGRRLALLGEGFDVRVWDVESGQILQTFAGHRHGLTSVAFAPDGRTLATASLDTTVLLWATPDRPRPPVALSADDAAAAWADLAAGDAAVAYRAMTRLRADPGRSLPLLRERLTRAPAVDDGRVGRWVAELDDERFGVRQQAARELAALGERAAPALRRLLANRPTLEARRRAEELLAKLDELTPDPQLLRDLRAVEVLEAVGTPDARTLLEELARRDPEARLTREAQASLDRWRRR